MPLRLPELGYRTTAPARGSTRRLQVSCTPDSANGAMSAAASTSGPDAVTSTAPSGVSPRCRSAPSSSTWTARALGATRGQIRAQFLAEAVLLSLAGGVIGVIAGAAATAAYARVHGETVVIPPQAWAGGLAAALLIGALAGLLPAIRAARLSPTQALWSI